MESSNAGRLSHGCLKGAVEGKFLTGSTCLKPRLRQVGGGAYQRLIQMCFGTKSIAQVQQNILKNTKTPFLKFFLSLNSLQGIEKTSHNLFVVIDTRFYY